MRKPQPPCTVEDCTRPIRVRGLCQPHYAASARDVAAGREPRYPLAPAKQWVGASYRRNPEGYDFAVRVTDLRLALELAEGAVGEAVKALTLGSIETGLTHLAEALTYTEQAKREFTMQQPRTSSQDDRAAIDQPVGRAS